MRTITVRGHGDDIISIGGAICEEFDAADMQVRWVRFSCGATLGVDLVPNGIWRISQHGPVPAGTTVTIDANPDDGTDRYSDIATITTSHDTVTVECLRAAPDSPIIAPDGHVADQFQALHLLCNTAGVDPDLWLADHQALTPLVVAGLYEQALSAWAAGRASGHNEPASSTVAIETVVDAGRLLLPSVMDRHAGTADR